MKDPIKLRTIFMGTSSFAATILETLLKNKYNVVSVYTRPDAKVGREQTPKKSDVKVLAEENKLKIFEPTKFTPEVIEELERQKPDLIIVASYGKILPEAVLKIPGFGAINVHASLLPKYRGPSPVQNALLMGEKETGATIMLMDKGIDTGEILSQEKIAIKADEKYPELLKRVAEISGPLLIETLGNWVRRKVTPQKQEDAKATYCQLIERQDGKIIWTEDAKSIFNRYRAFYPWPGIYSFWEKDGYNYRLKFHKVSYSEDHPACGCKNGHICAQDGKVFACAENGSLILEEVQLEGKSKMTISEFLNGYPNFIDGILK